MSEQDPELEAFSELIVAIEPWLGEVVLVGGWTHRLYRLDPRARKHRNSDVKDMTAERKVVRKAVEYLAKTSHANSDPYDIALIALAKLAAKEDSS